MAVGDIISDVTTGTSSTFQPAGTNQIIILFYGGGNTGQIGLSDGTNTSFNYYEYTAGGSTTTSKIGITNSVYLFQSTDLEKTMYSGIQIK